MEEQRFLVFISANAPILENVTGILPIEDMKGQKYFVCTQFEMRNVSIKMRHPRE